MASLNGQSDLAVFYVFPIFLDNAPQILWADLQEQRLNHLIGSSRMFNKVFDLLGERNVDYWFYMEPDTIPVRANWVEKIFHEAVCGNEFWIKGSTFRKGQEWFFKHIGDHFNGTSHLLVREVSNRS